MTKRSALDPEVVDRFIGRIQTDDTVIVGGQAVAFWAGHLGLAERRPAITADIDLYGMRADVEEASRQLASVPHDVRIATFDDASVNSGTIVLRPDPAAGLSEPLTIDYLHSVLGLNGPDIQARAVELTAGGNTLRLLHPALLLESKIANLGALPKTRGEAGVTQVRLAVAIEAAFVRRYVGWTSATRRAFLDLAERTGRLARSDAAHFAYHVFGIDVLEACPAALAPEDSEFARRRWLQITDLAGKRRNAFRRLFPEPPTPESTRGLRVG